MKFCGKCKTEKPFTDFSRNKARKDGYCNQCKECTSKRWNSYYTLNKDAVLERSREYYTANRESRLPQLREYQKNNKPAYAASCAKRKAAKLLATPFWSETEKIAVVYDKASTLGCEVDHVVPLQHPLVCGLHVWHNLQVLPTGPNRSKGNRYWPDMP